EHLYRRWLLMRRAPPVSAQRRLGHRDAGKNVGGCEGRAHTITFRETLPKFGKWVMDRLDAMSVLLAVVEAGSLSAASRRLGTPLATVSRKISELESHLKTKLLHRSTRQMTLTDAGRSYLDACRRIIEQVEEGVRSSRAIFA